MNNTPELRFKEFDDKWEKIKLGDKCTFYSGGTPLTTNKKYYDGNIPFIRSAEISSIETELSISEDGLNNSSAKMVKKGDLLYALYGATSGEVAISKIDGAIDQAILCIQSEQVNLSFLEKILRKNKDSIINTYLQGGQGNLSAKIVQDLRYYFPSLKEQEKITSFFSLIDKKIELQVEKIEELKKYKKGIMQRLFSQELRFKDDNGNDFPEWKEQNLHKILKEVSEKTKIINQYEVISSTNNGLYLQKDYFNREIASKDNVGYKILRRNQVVLSPQNLWMGNINLNNKYDIGMVSPSYKIFNIKEDFDCIYIGYILRTERAFYEYKQASEQGASIVRRNLNMDLFYDISLNMPCKAEQCKISNFIAKVDFKIDKEEEKLDYLNQYKKGLLQQMFV